MAEDQGRAASRTTAAAKRASTTKRGAAGAKVSPPDPGGSPWGARAMGSVPRHVAALVWGGERDAVDQNQVTSLAGKLAAGGALLTGLFTLLGISGSQLDRLLRNHPTGSIGLMALVAAGVLVGVFLSSAAGDIGRRLALLSVGAVAVVATIGAGVYHAWRHVDWSVEASVAILAGVLLAAVFLMALIRDGRLFLLVVGVISLLSGLTGMGVLSVTTKGAKDRPRIDAQLVRGDTGWTIEAKVEAQGLTSREHVRILVEGLSELDPLQGRVAGRARDPEGVLAAVDALPLGNDFNQDLHLSRIGPDADGKVSSTVKAPVTVGLYERVRVSVLLETEHDAAVLHDSDDLRMRYLRADEAARRAKPGSVDERRKARRAQKAYDRWSRFYDSNRASLEPQGFCDVRADSRACAVIMLPQPSVRPTVSITQADGGAVVRVRASDLNVDDLVELVVSAGSEVLARATIPPTTNGTVDQTVTVAAQDQAGAICATGRVDVFPARGVAIDHGRSGAPDGHPTARPDPVSPVQPGCGAAPTDGRVATAEVMVPGK